MSDVEQSVVTKFTGEDGISATLMSIARNATGVGAALGAAQAAVALLSGPMQYAQSGLQTIMANQQRAQSTQLELTSAFRAYEVFGQTSEQISAAVAHGADSAVLTSQAFEAAGRASTGIMRQITRDAANLPGTAQQYLEVFQQALPAALASTHQQVTEIASLTNHGAAVAIANGIDAAQAGRDMMAMFQGHADSMNRTYQVLGPLMTRSATDHRRLTQQGFNSMNGEQRFRAMHDAVALYQPMLDRMGASWEAATGSFESAISEMITGSTREIYTSVVSVAMTVNKFIEHYSFQIQNVGRLLSHWAVSAFASIEMQANAALSHLQRMGTWIMGQPWFNQLLNLGTHVASGLAARTVGPESTNNSRIGVAASATAMLGGPLAGLLFGSFAHFMQNGEAVAKVMGSVHTAVAAVVPLITRWVDLMGSASEAGGSIMSDVIPAVVEFGSMLVRGGTIVLGVMTTMLTPVFAAVGSAVAFAGSQFSRLIHELGGTSAVMGFFLRVMSVSASVMVSVFVSAIGAVATGLGLLLGALRHVIHFFNVLTHRRSDSYEENGLGHIPGREEAHPAWLDSILNAINQVDKTAKTTEQQNAGRHGQAPHARGGTHQDFRYSRFDITQKFSEGFDPDRIASVFTSDLEAMANNRLDSGFSPAFGLS